MSEFFDAINKTPREMIKEFDKGLPKDEPEIREEAENDTRKKDEAAI